MIKYADGSNIQMKARFMISDGIWAVMAIFAQDVHERMEGREIQQFDIIKVKTCITKPLSKD